MAATARRSVGITAHIIDLILTDHRPHLEWAM